MTEEEQRKTRPDAMTPGEKHHWEEHGYLVRRGVFSPAECEALRQVAEDLALGRRPFPGAHRDLNAKVKAGLVQAQGIAAYHKIHFPHLFNREFLDRVRDPRAVDPVEDILGPDILAINTLVIFKAPKIGLGFPWHQDKFYFRQSYITDTTVGTWQAIDDATVENGCLWVIPGSHREEVSEHDRLEGPQQEEFHLARNADESRGIPLEMQAGDLLWFHSHLFHKSIDNRTDAFRRCYVAHYLSACAKYVGEGKVHMPPMWVRGRTYPGHVQAHATDVLPENQWD